MQDDLAISYEWITPCVTHARQVMQWRNDPVTLTASFDQTPKQWPAFFHEFSERYFSTPNLPPLFALKEGKRVGFIRFRPVDPTSCEISLIIAPDTRGQGLATPILQGVSDLVRSQGYNLIHADIRLDNRISCKAFEKAGYVRICKETVHSPYNGHTADVWRYQLSLVDNPVDPDRVFVIAEAGSNWRCGTDARDWQMACALVDVAVEAGADAVKFQTYRPETVYVENAGQSDYLAESGIQEEVRAIFSDLAMPYSMLPKLADYCKSQGILFMSTPFSAPDFNAVNPYVSVHKLASYELAHIRLLELVAQSGKPLILSTGAANEEDVQWAVNYYRQCGGQSLTLLQCTAKYPAEASSLNLQVIPTLRRRFGTQVGLSDHSRDPILAPVSAVALGATVIEKHFTLDNRLPGPDHAFAILPGELKAMVAAIREAEQMRGTGIKSVMEAEQELASYARRGVQALQEIREGDLLQEGVNVDILRPGQQKLGVHPRYLEALEGKPAKRTIPLGSGVQQGDWGV